MLARLASLVPLVFGVLALSSCEGATPTKPPTQQPNTVKEDATGITVYTPEFDVPPGDSFTCIYMDYQTASELTVLSAQGQQEAGGHHEIAYYANDPRP